MSLDRASLDGVFLDLRGCVACARALTRIRGIVFCFTLGV